MASEELERTKKDRRFRNRNAKNKSLEKAASEATASVKRELHCASLCEGDTICEHKPGKKEKKKKRRREEEEEEKSRRRRRRQRLARDE
jgi:hypothetical protein